MTYAKALFRNVGLVARGRGRRGTAWEAPRCGKLEASKLKNDLRLAPAFLALGVRTDGRDVQQAFPPGAPDTDRRSSHARSTRAAGWDSIAGPLFRRPVSGYG